jgi:hypothetical protein
VFQFESRGMQGMLRDAKPTRLEDLIALNALYRPGPMDLIPSFVARKHGREVVEYPHPLVADMLSETYGIMVYQEQVMQTAQISGRLLAGRRRHAAPCHGQEKGRGDGRAPCHLPRRVPPRTTSAKPRPTRCLT